MIEWLAAEVAADLANSDSRSNFTKVGPSVGNPVGVSKVPPVDSSWWHGQGEGEGEGKGGGPRVEEVEEAPAVPTLPPEVAPAAAPVGEVEAVWS